MLVIEKYAIENLDMDAASKFPLLYNIVHSSIYLLSQDEDVDDT